MGVGGLFWEYSGRGLSLTTHPHLVLRLMKEYYPVWGEIYLYLNEAKG
jgi:hypothetical protein